MALCRYDICCNYFRTLYFVTCMALDVLRIMYQLRKHVNVQLSATLLNTPLPLKAYHLYWRNSLSKVQKYWTPLRVPHFY